MSLDTDGTEDGSTSRVLREVMAARVATLPPPVGLYEAVRRRRRRSRRGLALVAALAVVAVGLGVPAGLYGLRGTAAPSVGPGTASPTLTPSATPARNPNGVRGSLAGDRDLLARAVVVARRQFTGMTGRIDPATVHPVYADQADGSVVVLVVGQRRSDHWVSFAWVGHGPDSSTLRANGSEGFIDTPSFDIKMGQHFLDPLWVSRAVTIDGRRFGVVIVPPDSRVDVRDHVVLNADCTVGGQPRSVPLVDGTALFPLQPGQAPWVTVADGTGRKVVDRPLAAMQPLSLRQPTEQEIAALMAGARGQAVDRDVVRLALAVLRPLLVENPMEAYTLVWGGLTPASHWQAVLAGVRLSGGITLLLGWQSEGGNTSGGDLRGCLPTAQVDRRVIAWRINDGSARPLMIVGPSQSARAEVVFADGTVVPVALHDGGGFLNRSGPVSSVRAYDSAGRLLDARGLGGGLLDYPTM